MQGRGVPTRRAERSGGLHKRSAEDWEALTPREGGALRKAWFGYGCRGGPISGVLTGFAIP